MAIVPEGTSPEVSHVCAWYTRNAGDPNIGWLRGDLQRLKRVVRVVFQKIAIVHAARTDDGEADLEAEGYLVRRIDAIAVRVPFHLFDALPDGGNLAEMVRLGGRLRSRRSRFL